MKKESYPVYRYTTPSIVLKFRGLHLTNAELVRIKLRRGQTEVLRSTAEDGQIAVDTVENTATISLTQQESAAFSGGLVTVQAHIRLATGAVAATEQQQIFFDDNIDEEVL